MKRKTAETAAVDQLIRESAGLNHRQRSLLSHALRHPDAEYTLASYRSSHNVVYETARTDLQDLVRRKLLTMKRIGRTFVFEPAPNLAELLREL